MSTDSASTTGILAGDRASLMPSLRPLERVSSTKHTRNNHAGLRKQ
jgi:hypothetical protein